ncbi:MAG: GHKL domain-containing protein [Verrucomicrobia bacterium]|nr:GHKL domain-containing protein [Cytophagales bacterium]
MKSLESRIVLRILLLTVTLLASSYLFISQLLTYAILILLIALYQIFSLIRFINKSNRELAQFAMAVRYRDFSQHFNEKEPSVHELRRAFNTVNKAFKEINFEKEAQYQYLTKILDLVNTGILSYDVEGEVRWLNESLKKMLGIPYLKNIRSLKNRDEKLYEVLIQLKAGQPKLTEISGKETKKILLSATNFRIEEAIFTIVAFQNVEQALEETETQAWQKLLRVLTHEIMNSIAPIASLADTLKRRLNNSSQSQKPDNELITDLETGIEVIRNRSENLLRFAETYRHLNKISQPNLSEIYIRNLFENMEILLEQKLLQQNIDLEIILKNPDLQVKADAGLVEQVLLNLVLNAIEAVSEKPEPVIKISAYLNENQRVIIEISDNGSGIPAEMLDKIFIPFFTTKKTGSGIGLSLSKQIMQLHNGNLTAKSIENQGSIFRMMF